MNRDAHYNTRSPVLCSFKCTTVPAGNTSLIGVLRHLHHLRLVPETCRLVAIRRLLREETNNLHQRNLPGARSSNVLPAEERRPINSLLLQLHSSPNNRLQKDKRAGLHGNRILPSSLRRRLRKPLPCLFLLRVRLVFSGLALLETLTLVEICHIYSILYFIFFIYVFSSMSILYSTRNSWFYDTLD